jgi:hypothetical protein
MLLLLLLIDAAARSLFNCCMLDVAASSPHEASSG